MRIKIFVIVAAVIIALLSVLFGFKIVPSSKFDTKPTIEPVATEIIVEPVTDTEVQPE